MSNRIPILSTKKLKATVARKALFFGLDLFDADFIEIGYKVSTSVAEALSNEKKYLVFTSRHGVKGYALNKAIAGIQFQKQKAYCLQGETQKAVEEAGDIEIVTLAKDARSLAAKIIADNHTKEVSYICGNRRRGELPELLSLHQLKVNEMVVYETRNNGQPIKHRYEAVLFFSPSAAENFFQTNILPQNIPCFCIGVTTAAAVEKYTVNPIIIATQTTQESMLEAVQVYFKRIKKQNQMIVTKETIMPVATQIKNDLLLKALKGENVHRPPVWMMRQAGRYLPQYREIKKKYDFFMRVQTPALAAEITLQPVDIIGTDAAIIFSDILVVPLAMGMQVEMSEGGGPTLPQIIRSMADVNRLSVREAHHDLHYVYEAIRLTKQQLKGKVPLIGFSGAPWTLLCYMVEGKGNKTFDKAKSFCYTEPEAAHALLQHITTVCISYLKEQVKAGADCLQLFDSWGGLWDKEDFAVFSLPYIKQIVESLKDDCPVIVFSKGVWHSLPELQQTGASALGIDWHHTARTARVLTNNSITLQGNYDPVKLLQPVKKIQQDVNEMINAFGTKNYIVNLGHGIIPSVPVDHAKAFVNAVKEWKQQ